MVLAGAGILIGGGSGSAVIGTGSALGALLASSNALPTATKTDQELFESPGFTLTLAADAPSGFSIHSDDQLEITRFTSGGAVENAEWPEASDGLWIVLKIGDAETDRYYIGRDVYVLSANSPELDFARRYSGGSALHQSIKVDYQEVDSSGAVVQRIRFAGAGTNIPANSTVEIYFALAGGTRGPRGQRGRDGQDGTNAGAANLPQRVSSTERQQGTENQPRTFAPDDIAIMAALHSRRADWDNTDTNSPAFIENKPDFQGPVATASEAEMRAGVVTGNRLVSPAFVRDAIQAEVARMLTGNTETGISVVYQPSDNTIDFLVSSGGQTTPPPSTHQRYFYWSTSATTPTEAQIKNGVGSTAEETVINTATGTNRQVFHFYIWSAEQLTTINNSRGLPGQNLLSQFTETRLSVDSVNGYLYAEELFPGSIGTASAPVTWTTE